MAGRLGATGGERLWVGSGRWWAQPHARVVCTRVGAEGRWVSFPPLLEQTPTHSCDLHSPDDGCKSQGGSRGRQDPFLPQVKAFITSAKSLSSAGCHIQRSGDQHVDGHLWHHPLSRSQQRLLSIYLVPRGLLSLSPLSSQPPCKRGCVSRLTDEANAAPRGP